MKIKRGGMAEPINAKSTTNPLPKYCPVCEAPPFKLRIQLHKRVYDLHDPNQCPYGMLPADHDDWLQCYHCGNTFLDDRVAQEGKLRIDLQISKPSTQREEEHWEKPKHRRGFNERLEREPEIKDPEVRAAIKKGLKVISYSEQ